jgi:mRNA interferase RelE/StbE
MARYELRVKLSVAKDLRGLPKADIRRILWRIEALRADPRAPGCEKLAGAGDLYRARQSVYRIVYSIHDGHLVVEVIRVGHRGEVYRGRG